MIALDATYSVGEALTGVGVYCSEILNGLAHAHPEERFQFCYRVHRYRQAWGRPLPPNASRFLLHDRWRTPGGANLFHGLNQRMPSGKLRRRVCTFHDLFVVTNGFSTTEFRDRFTRIAREAAERSDLIIAVSNFTARQATDLLGVAPERIRVVHHGVVAPRISAAEFSRERIVLHVGALQARKNIVRLVEAFERMPEDWRLTLASSMGYGSEAILHRIEHSAARDRIELAGFVDDQARAALYRRACMLAFPSLGEGFGMPVLEAMAAGLPVICSSTTALPEVAGDAALFVDPEQTDEIAEAMRRLGSDLALREQLQLKGQERAKQFSWERAVAQTWAVYGELLR